MNDLETNARKIRINEIDQIIGNLFLYFPYDDMSKLLDNAAKLHDLVENFEKDYGKTETTKNIGSVFLGILKYSKVRKDEN